jgi:hypothetical protein
MERRISERYRRKLLQAAYDLMTRRWFATLEGPSISLEMCVFLMHVYVHNDVAKKLLDKTDVYKWGFGDERTARKYIAAAQRRGLVRLVKQPDRRREFLEPTELLRRAIKNEVERLAVNLVDMAYDPGSIADFDVDTIDDEIHLKSVPLKSQRRRGARLTITDD